MSATPQRMTDLATGALNESLLDLVKAACKEAIAESNTPIPFRAKRMLQVPAAASYIGVSPREVYNMLENHLLPSVKYRSRRLLDIEDLDAWIAANKE